MKKPGEKSDSARAEVHSTSAGRGTRETVESIVIAIALAFLFRAFEAEAFVIPTGSMAPTLQGRHVDLECPECGYWYRVGASDVNAIVQSVTCPICRYTLEMSQEEFQQNVFTGDRILVSKFAYELPDSWPQRWDVIVFKFPGNAKQNYIKRLIGLPGERIRIHHGNIYVKQEGPNARFRIARKTDHSPAKLKAMLQLVDDTKYLPSALAGAGWPSRWQETVVPGKAPTWQAVNSGQGFATDGKDGENWLRYRHILPDEEVWASLAAWNTLGRIDEIDTPQEANVVAGMLDLAPYEQPLIIRSLLEGYDENHNGVLEHEEKAAALRHRRTGQLITDFYAYNDADLPIFLARGLAQRLGLDWVPDVALEAEIEVSSEDGELALKLVKAGIDYECRIDIASGKATLSIDGGKRSFEGEDGKAVQHPVAEDCGIAGPGRYQVRFSNVDDELFLWIDDWPVKFNSPTSYAMPGENLRPVWSPEDPGDLAPLGIASNGAALKVTRLRVLRDVYYIADREGQYPHDFHSFRGSDDEIWRILSTPDLWGQTDLFDNWARLELPDADPTNKDGYLGPDQFLPLGDNSPQSRDARMWNADDIPTSFSRKLLLGKALFIYWPHPWYGFVPNFSRMGFIR